MMASHANVRLSRFIFCSRETEMRFSSIPQILNVVYVRLRFVLVLLVIFVVVGKWDTLRTYWDALVRLGKADQRSQPVSTDTEYFCPMCPGVLSDWPAKCPVCNMGLVRRKKGDAAPMPDGVVARMQLSPYRLQLAGVRTTAVSYEPLAYEIATGGFVLPVKEHPQGQVQAPIYEQDVPLLEPGQPAEIVCAALPGRPSFVGKVSSVITDPTGRSVLLSVDSPDQDMRPGLFVQVRIRLPLATRGRFANLWQDDWRQRTSLEIVAHALSAADGVATPAGFEALARAAGACLLTGQGKFLAVPESAVLDTGTQKIVYVETAPGMFDAVELSLGPRAGAFYPVLAGLTPGQRVATTGAFLLDAETRLNSNLAASYFGASGSAPAAAAGKPGIPTFDQALERLAPADRELARQQKTCPITGEPLGSMGTPIFIVREGKKVFLCCKACEKAALRKQ
jgi:hypothetical protein